MLLLITNWFFHRSTGPSGSPSSTAARKQIERGGVGFLSAQVLGLRVLGLTSVYREGFETVLFLQSLRAQRRYARRCSRAPALGLAMTLGVAVLTFALQRKLPYKKMLIVTGVLIGFVLVVMVGQTARTMQGTGWLSITPVDLDLPYWAGLWFGVYPTWETIGAQIAAFAFVIGSYAWRRRSRYEAPAGARRGAAPRPRPSACSSRLDASSGRARAFPGCRSPRRKVVSVSNASVYGEPVLGEVPGR